MKNLRRELASAKVELEKLSRPLHEDIASSTVSATVKNGESLVIAHSVKRISTTRQPRGKGSLKG